MNRLATLTTELRALADAIERDGEASAVTQDTLMAWERRLSTLREMIEGDLM